MRRLKKRIGAVIAAVVLAVAAGGGEPQQRLLNTLDVSELRWDGGMPLSVRTAAGAVWNRTLPEPPSANISDLYRGAWLGANSSKMAEIDGVNPNPLLNGSLGTGEILGGATSYRIQSRIIEFAPGKAQHGPAYRPFGESHYVSGTAVLRGSGASARPTVMWIEGVYSPGSGRVFAVMYPRGTFPTALDFLTTGRYGHGAKDGGGPDGSSSGGGNGGNGVTVTHTPSGDIVVIGSGGRQGNQTVATYRDEHVEVVRRMRLAQFAMSGMLPPSYEGFGYHEDTRTGVLPKQYCLLKLYGIVELQRRGAAGNGTSAAGDGSSSVDGGDDVNNPGIHEGIDYSRMMYPSDLVRGTLGGGGGAAGRGYAEREPGLMTMTSVAFSPDCHVAIDVDATAIEIAAFGAKVSNYVTMVMIVSLAQVYVLVRQAESMSTQAGAAKLSLFSIGMMALIDAYLCLFQLSSAVLAPFAFSSFMIAVFLKFVIFSIFEMRVMIAIWKVRRGPGDPDALYFVLLFSRFYLVLASGFFLVFWLQQYFYLILLALYSFWVPQVWHSVRNNVRRPHEPRFVAVMSLTRLAIPLYFTGCPSNFYGFHSSPAFALTLVAWVVAQGTLVILQGIWGPRFFVPRRFVPDSYDYRRVPLRDLDEMELGNVATDGSGGNDCVICMMEISAEHVSTGATMLTPCGHMFHGACLERWMEIKLECPTCRSALPPV